jgi:Ca-activated chloride channel family protein
MITPAQVQYSALRIVRAFLAAGLVGVSAAAALAEQIPPIKSDRPIDAELVKPAQMQSGTLLLRAAKPGWYVQAPRVATDIRIQINGPLARTRITQRFENPSQSWVEGVYVFPLPDDAAVDTLKLRIGERLIEGRIKPREAAKKIYDKAKREGRRASLVEQQRPNMFTNSIANIGPGETVVVQIEYQQTIALSDNVYSVRIPMVVAPRYGPERSLRTVRLGSDATHPAIADMVRDGVAPPVLNPANHPNSNPVFIEIDLKAGFPIGTLKSQHHQITTKTLSRDHVVLTLSDKVVAADRDFELTWSAGGADAPATALFRQRVGGTDYLLATIMAPDLGKNAAFKQQPREVIFVIDTSGSMAGESIDQARESLMFALDRLTPMDRFNIIRFDSEHVMLRRDAVFANAPNLERARAFVASLRAEGGTRMLPALRTALTDRRQGKSDTLRQVIFLTDGAINDERRLFGEIVRLRGRSRIFTVGIGSAPNTFFMRRAAEAGRGTFTHIGSQAQVRERMENLLTKLERPAVTHLQATWSQSGANEMAPDPPPDLYYGEPVVLAARVRDLEGTLTLTGRYDGRAWRRELSIADALDANGPARLWARRMIDRIEFEGLTSGDRNSADRRIEEIALAHNLVSRRTSLIAVDVTPARPRNTHIVRAQVPLNLPAGWDFGAVFSTGTDGGNANRQRDANRHRGSPSVKLRYAGLKAVATPIGATEASLTSVATSNVILPATATTSGLKLTLGLVSIVFGLLLAMITVMWRRLLRQIGRFDRPTWETWK